MAEASFVDSDEETETISEQRSVELGLGIYDQDLTFSNPLAKTKVAPRTADISVYQSSTTREMTRLMRKFTPEIRKKRNKIRALTGETSFGFTPKDGVEKALKMTLEVVQDHSLSTEIRYSFFYFIKHSKIVYECHLIFVLDVENDVQYRILSGQYVLTYGQGWLTDDGKLDKVNDALIIIATDSEQPDSVLQDVADVLLRVGNLLGRAVGYNVIVELSFKNIKTRVRDFYSNQQNIHDEDIQRCILRFIKDELRNDKPPFILGADGVVTPQTFTDVMIEIESILKEKGMLNDSDVRKAISRILMDTSLIGGVTARQALQLVWNRIKNDPNRDDLITRFIQELKDMSDTCSTGHTGRLVNVLAGTHFIPFISYKKQLISNIKARVETAIRDEPDEDKKSNLVIGLVPDAEEEYAQVLHEFVFGLKDSLHETLLTEFSNYMSEQEFDTVFNETIRAYLSYKDGL
jgi:hypothetical protein